MRNIEESEAEHENRNRHEVAFSNVKGLAQLTRVITSIAGVFDANPTRQLFSPCSGPTTVPSKIRNYL